MGHKVNISDVKTFSDDLTTTSAEIKASLDEIKSNIDQINMMDSFSGKAAKQAKGYFNNLHITVLDAFNELFTDIDTNLKKHIEVFQSNVDSSGSAIVESDYLNDTNDKVDLEYKKMNGHHQSIKSSIQGVSDISSVSAPELYAVTADKRDVTEIVTELDGNFSSFTGEGKYHDSQTKALLHRIEVTMNEVNNGSSKTRFTDYTANNALVNLKDALTIYIAPGIAGSTTSIAIAKAAKDKGLGVSNYVKNGKVTYRINASESALKELGVKPDVHAKNAMNQRSKSGNAKAPLNYYDKKTGKQVWSKTGQDVIKNHPAMEAYNDKISRGEKFKTVGKATFRGAKDSITDLNPKGFVSGSVASRAGKALGPLGIGLNYYSNYNDAHLNGLTGGEAHSKAAVNTTIDTVIGGAVQAGFTAAGTAFIPIPGVGTAVGAGLGIVANSFLNLSIGKSGKSIMDRTKDAFHKITGWFS